MISPGACGEDGENSAAPAPAFPVAAAANGGSSGDNSDGSQRPSMDPYMWAAAFAAGMQMQQQQQQQQQYIYGSWDKAARSTPGRAAQGSNERRQDAGGVAGVPTNRGGGQQMTQAQMQAAWMMWQHQMAAAMSAAMANGGFPPMPPFAAANVPPWSQMSSSAGPNFHAATHHAGNPGASQQWNAANWDGASTGAYDNGGRQDQRWPEGSQHGTEPAVDNYELGLLERLKKEDEEQDAAAQAAALEENRRLGEEISLAVKNFLEGGDFDDEEESDTEVANTEPPNTRVLRGLSCWQLEPEGGQSESGDGPGGATVAHVAAGETSQQTAGSDGSVVVTAEGIEQTNESAAGAEAGATEMTTPSKLPAEEPDTTRSGNQLSADAPEFTMSKTKLSADAPEFLPHKAATPTTFSLADALAVDSPRSEHTPDPSRKENPVCTPPKESAPTVPSQTSNKQFGRHQPMPEGAPSSEGVQDFLNVLRRRKLPGGLDNLTVDKWQQVKSVLLKAVETLYRDQIRPAHSSVQKRLRDHRASSVVIQAVLPLCARMPEQFRIMPPMNGEQPVILLTREPRSFAGWIDSLPREDKYSPEEWEGLMQFIRHDNFVMLPMPVSKAAEELKSKGPPVLQRLSLGELDHMLRLAMGRRRVLDLQGDAIVPSASTQQLRAKFFACKTPEQKVSGPQKQVQTLTLAEHILGPAEIAPPPGLEAPDTGVADAEAAQDITPVVRELMWTHPNGMCFTQLKQQIRSRCQRDLVEKAFQCTKIAEFIQRAGDTPLPFPPGPCGGTQKSVERFPVTACGQGLFGAPGGGKQTANI